MGYYPRVRHNPLIYMGPSAMATPVDMPGAYDRPHPSLPIPINSPLISPPISSQPLSNNTHTILYQKLRHHLTDFSDGDNRQCLQC